MTASLALALLMVIGLAVQAWRADRRHHQVAEAALSDWSRFAAARYKARVEALIFNSLTTVFRPIGGRIGGGHQPSLDDLAAAVDQARRCRCTPFVEPLALFHLHLESGALELRAGTTAHLEPARLASAVERHTRRHQDEWEFAVMLDTTSGRVRPVLYTVAKDSRGHPRHVYGIVAEMESFAAAILAQAAGEEVLPREITGGMPNDSLFTVAVRGVGRTIYRDLGPASTGAISTTLHIPSIAGGLDVEVGLRPEAARRLLSGGAPQSGTPLLAGLTLASVTLLVAAGALARRAAALARARTEFIASVSHDLRTPLAEILLYAETMVLGRLESIADYRREAGVIMAEGRRLLYLVENVLHFAGDRARVMPSELRVRLVTPTVARTVDSIRPLAESAGVDLQAECDGTVAAPLDPVALERALRNLLDNSLKYAADGRAVRVRLERRGDTARLSVEDDGPGIPPADRERVVRPFARLARDVERAATGSGLGLAIAADVARRHDGRLVIDSAPGGGTRVSLEWPGAVDAHAATVAA